MSPLFVRSESWERDAPSDLSIETVRVSVDIRALFASKRQIVEVWGIKDVQEVRPKLSDEQAWQVLQEVERNQDAAVGINWEVLEAAADEFLGSLD